MLCWDLLCCRVSIVGGTLGSLIRATNTDPGSSLHVLWPRPWGRAGEGWKGGGGGWWRIVCVAECHCQHVPLSPSVLPPESFPISLRR